MNPSISRRQHQRFFTWVVLSCNALAVGYTSWVILSKDANANHAQSQVQKQGNSQDIARPEELQVIQREPHLIFLQEVGPHYGQVTLAGLEPALSRQARTTLGCDRVYYAAGNGICLVYDSSTPAEDPLAPIPVQVTLFGSDLRPRHKFTVEGLPSRARVSPDGKVGYGLAYRINWVGRKHCPIVNETSISFFRHLCKIKPQTWLL
jgi:hypothetical protein